MILNLPFDSTELAPSEVDRTGATTSFAMAAASGEYGGAVVISWAFDSISDGAGGYIKE